MRDSQYANMVFPASTSFTTQDADCCNSATGSAPAASAQEHRTEALAAAGAGVVSFGTGSRRGRGGCRCWWIALAAVVAIALVAKS